ncbi:MAG: hypothetical protein S4CHLAM2_02610 [Chlamydiales bacterium]|nr:hypothetical protein [Chlamydiales bacterium]
MASVGPPGKPDELPPVSPPSSSKAQQVLSSKQDLIEAHVQNYQIYKIPLLGGILKALFGNMTAKQAIKDQILGQIGFQNKDALNGLSLVQLNQLARATGPLQLLGNRFNSFEKANFVREWIQLTPQEVNVLQDFADGKTTTPPYDLASYSTIWETCKEISSLTNTTVLLDECIDSVLEGTSQGRPLQCLMSRETSKFSLDQEILPSQVLYGRNDDEKIDASKLYVRVCITHPVTLETRTLRLSFGLTGTMTVREAREKLNSSKQDWIKNSKQEMGKCIKACSRGEVDLKRNKNRRLELKDGSVLTKKELQKAREGLDNGQPFSIQGGIQVQFQHEEIKIGDTGFTRLKTTISDGKREYTRETYYNWFDSLRGEESPFLERDLQLARMEFNDASV